MGIMLTGCKKEDKRQKFPSPSLQVSAITVHQGEVPITYEYAGRVFAFKETAVRARVGGLLLRRHFVEGSWVKQGALLFQIDPTPYEADITRQEALVAQAEVSYNQSVRDAVLADELLQHRVQSKVLRDQAVAHRDTAAAILQQAQATLRTAKLNLEYTKVLAPISGITSQQFVPEGSLIGTDPSSSLLAMITQRNPVYVNFSYTDFEERQIRQLMKDMNIRGERINHLKVRIRFGRGQHYYSKIGTIDFTSSTLDSTTGTRGVRAVVDNSEDVLIPGQFVRVTVIGLKLDKAIVIPEAALLQDRNGTFVYVVHAGAYVEKRSVIVDRQLEDRRWLLAVNRQVHSMSGDTPLLGNSDNQETQSVPAGQEDIGLEDGDIVVTEGHFRINTALEKLPKGQKLKVAITTLDGEDLIFSRKEPGQVESAQ